MALTRDLNQLKSENRLEIRQLVKDTFKSILLKVDRTNVQKLSGLERLIETNLAGGQLDNCFELTLEFHNSKKRLLRLDKHSGALLAGFDLQ